MHIIICYDIPDTKRRTRLHKTLRAYGQAVQYSVFECELSPRQLLLDYGVATARPLAVRVGLATGEVCIGHTGTYQKMSYTALGTTANLAARLQSAAERNQPCLSRATYEKVQRAYRYKDEAGREVEAKGLPKQRVWDVLATASQTEQISSSVS